MTKDAQQSLIKNIGLVMIFTAGILTFYFIDQGTLNEKIDDNEKEIAILHQQVENQNDKLSELITSMDNFTLEVKQSMDNLSINNRQI